MGKTLKSANKSNNKCDCHVSTQTHSPLTKPIGGMESFRKEIQIKREQVTSGCSVDCAYGGRENKENSFAPLAMFSTSCQGVVHGTRFYFHTANVCSVLSKCASNSIKPNNTHYRFHLFISIYLTLCQLQIYFLKFAREWAATRIVSKKKNFYNWRRRILFFEM